jgi:hypothetical protein
MSTTFDSQEAFHRGTAQVFALLTAEQTERLARLQGDPTLNDRVEELAARANEGLLTAAERAEYEGYIKANNLLAVLQAEARYHSMNRPR